MGLVVGCRQTREDVAAAVSGLGLFPVQPAQAGSWTKGVTEPFPQTFMIQAMGGQLA
jgi:hypothetical protein